MPSKLFHTQVIGTVNKKMMDIFFQNRVLQVGDKFIERGKYKAPVLYLRVRHLQGFFPDDLFVEEEDIDVDDAGCIFYCANPAHLFFNLQNGLHGLPGVEPRIHYDHLVQEIGLAGIAPGGGSIQAGAPGYFADLFFDQRDGLQ